MLFKTKSFGLSDRGRVRDNNEDVFDSLAEEGFFILADGMGGHQAGEVAAHKTVESILAMVRAYSYSVTLEQQNKEEVAHLLEESIRHANAELRYLGREEERFTGMGTTVCCLCLRKDFLVCAHVGDSRIYRLRQQELTPLTCDHSLIMDLLHSGQMNEQQAKSFRRRNVITRAVGIEDVIQPTLNTFDAHKGDLYLLCSDGLSDYVSAESIKEILLFDDNLKKVGEQLVEEAKNLGSKDNITVLIVKILE